MHWAGLVFVVCITSRELSLMPRISLEVYGLKVTLSARLFLLLTILFKKATWLALVEEQRSRFNTFNVIYCIRHYDFTIQHCHLLFCLVCLYIPMKAASQCWP